MFFSVIVFRFLDGVSESESVRVWFSLRGCGYKR